MTIALAILALSLLAMLVTILRIGRRVKKLSNEFRAAEMSVSVLFEVVKSGIEGTTIEAIAEALQIPLDEIASLVHALASHPNPLIGRITSQTKGDLPRFILVAFIPLLPLIRWPFQYPARNAPQPSPEE